MHRLTGGVPDYTKKLFTAAQANIIGNSGFPDEQLTTEVLTRTMQESFTDLHVRLEAKYRRNMKQAERATAAAAAAAAAANAAKCNTKTEANPQ